jgi:hypothetical protein
MVCVPPGPCKYEIHDDAILPNEDGFEEEEGEAEAEGVGEVEAPRKTREDKWELRKQWNALREHEKEK